MLLGRVRSLLVLAAAAGLLGAPAQGADEPAGAQPAESERRALAAAAAGDLRAAIPLYEEAARGYQARGDAQGRFRALLRQGELERDLGRSHDAITRLEAAAALVDASPEADRPLADDPLAAAQTAAVRAALASAWLDAGDTTAAEVQLLRAEQAAGRAREPALLAAVALERGRLEEQLGRWQPAREAYARAAEAAAAAGDRSITFLALVNRAHVSQVPDARQERAAARDAGDGLPASRSHAYGWVRLARAGLRLPADATSPAPIDEDVDADLERALAMARATGDPGATSWALGTRSEVRSRQGREAEALALAHEALRAALQARDGEAQLRWLTRLGRLEAAAGETDAAIAHLSRAVELQAEQRLARATAPDGPGSDGARDDGVYAALADLLLRRAPRQPDAQRATADRLSAQQTLERLKAAELRDYFRDDCVDAYRAKVKSPAAASPRAAVIYPIALEDRLEILVSSRDGIAQFTVDVTRERLDAAASAFARSVRSRASFDFMAPARELHGWLIAPALAHLEQLGVDTLVFVPGGKLRTIPLAALHDGESFLIERFALAVTPGLELTDPQPLRREGARVFLGGLSEPVDGFPGLEYVPAELESVHEIFGGEIVLNEAFTTAGIERRLDAREFGIVHIATHGQFAPTSQDTFLLTHDGRLTLDALAEAVGAFRYRETPLDLILLSACETAVGDERAALGLAGIAVKAGARSAIGSLWTVNDAATAVLIQELYAQLAQPGVSRAQALRSAQRKLLEDLRYRHPGYWSSFLLISSWL